MFCGEHSHLLLKLENDMVGCRNQIYLCGYSRPKNIFRQKYLTQHSQHSQVILDRGATRSNDFFMLLSNFYVFKAPFTFTTYFGVYGFFVFVSGIQYSGSTENAAYKGLLWRIY